MKKSKDRTTECIEYLRDQGKFIRLASKGKIENKNGLRIANWSGKDAWVWVIFLDDGK